VGRREVFGRTPVFEFFPFERIMGGTTARGTSLQFTNLIPDEAMGDLFDDICRFSDCRVQGCPFGLVTLTVAVVNTEVILGESGFLEDLGAGHPVIGQLNLDRSVPKVQVPKSLATVERVFYEVCRRARKLEIAQTHRSWSPELCAPLAAALQEGKCFIRDHSWDQEVLGWLLGFKAGFNAKQIDFEAMLTKIPAELAACEPFSAGSSEPYEFPEAEGLIYKYPGRVIGIVKRSGGRKSD
jgi:hypothetical protein